jgi:hypothetical protein
MEPDTFAQTMPLFGTRGNCRSELITATSRRQHPALVAIGSSCRVPHSAGGICASPSASRFEPSYRLLNCYSSKVAQRQTWARSAESQLPFPRVRRDHVRGSSHGKTADVNQLVCDEQIARLKLLCSEQEERVDIALSRPRCPQCLSGVDKELGASVPRPTKPPHSFPSVANGKGTHAPGVDEALKAAVGRRGGQASPQNRRAAKKQGAPHTQCAVESSPPPCYVRDSELLRALQRAEERIRELESGLLSPAGRKDKNPTSANSACTQLPDNEDAQRLPEDALQSGAVDNDMCRRLGGRANNYPYRYQSLVIL